MIWANQRLFLQLVFFNLTSAMIFNVQIFLERDQLQKVRKDEKM